MDALFGQEVKSTRGESGRCLGEIDVLAGSQDNQGPSRQKRASHQAWAGRVAGLSEHRRAYCSPSSAGRQKSQPFVGWPVTALAAALREGKS